MTQQCSKYFIDNTNILGSSKKQFTSAISNPLGKSKCIRGNGCPHSMQTKMQLKVQRSLLSFYRNKYSRHHSRITIMLYF